MTVSAVASIALAMVQQQLDRSAEWVRRAALPESGQEHLDLSEEAVGLLVARAS
jgi:hypothetical protein